MNLKRTRKTGPTSRVTQPRTAGPRAAQPRATARTAGGGSVAASLNPSQRAAVEHDLGPLLVLAGAGSGKTRVVTTRIARLIERGVSARSILTMTFTNKAAAEMRERVAALVGAAQARELVVSTFHSFGLRVLAAEARRFGFRNGEFTIFDQADTMGALREILRTIDAGRKLDLSAIAARISRAKNHFIDDADVVERVGDDYDEITKLVLPRYRAALRGFQAFDFDDLVCEPVRLWRRHADLREKWQARYRYLLVDEYQDTNHAQLEMVQKLAAEHRNICVVGDDDQSIYGWRGAEVSNILDFERHFPGAKIVRLEDNYRSTGGILAVANAVLNKSAARRHAKALRAARGAGEPVERVTTADTEVEAAFVADEIRTQRDGGVPAREIAVLYRSNLQAEPFETALRERGVPTRTVGGTAFYERKEVKDLLSYMKVALNPRDEIALRRIVNYPSRGIGETAIERLGTAALARDQPLWDAVVRAKSIDGLSASAVDGCSQLVHVVSEARHGLETGKPPAEVARQIVDAIGLKEDLHLSSPNHDAATRRWDGVKSLMGVFERHAQRAAARADASGSSAPTATSEAGVAGSPLERFAELVQFLTLSPREEEEDAGNVVTLTTIHAAKGLEYRCAFVVGIEEGLMPHSRVVDPHATDVGGHGGADVEEERRLFYVAVTRAKDRLWLCRTKMRVLRGRPTPRTPSRFWVEIPESLVTDREVSAVAPPAAAVAVTRGQALLLALGKKPG